MRQPAGAIHPCTRTPFLWSRPKKGGKEMRSNAGPALGAWSEAVHCSYADEPDRALPQPGIDPPAGNTGRTWQPAPARPSGERRSPNERAGWRSIHRSSALPSLSAKSDPYPGRRIAPPDLAQHSTGSSAYEQCTAWTEAPRARAALSAFLLPHLFFGASKEKSGSGVWGLKTPKGSQKAYHP